MTHLMGFVLGGAILVAENCSRELCPYTVPVDKKTDHIPSNAPYSLAECVDDHLTLQLEC
jgi:hypothetical protein